jgi:hypothetical protein
MFQGSGDAVTIIAVNANTISTPKNFPYDTSFSTFVHTDKIKYNSEYYCDGIWPYAR